MRLLVLYGSQTGTAQDVAEQIWRESKQYSFTGPLMSMDDYDIQNLIQERLVVFVVATTGQGDEPDNMKKFWKFLLRKSLPSNSLSALNFACVGLGDSSYTKYNFAAKKLNKRLIQLSATPVIPIGLCDDQHDHGIAATLFPWTQSFWAALTMSHPNLTKTNSTDFCYKWQVIESDKPSCTDLDGLKWPLKSEPLTFTVIENVRKTSEDHFQDVRLIKFKFPEGIKWMPGDVLDVRPCNCDEKVEEFFKILDEHNIAFNRKTVVEFKELHDDPNGVTEANIDDEYRWAGCEDPKIMITTSHSPSARLKMFVKELRLIFPNAQRMNRGNYEMKQLMHACRANDVTDFIIVHEHRGVPDNLVICHLPYGPTAFFNISGVVMRHDVPDVGSMSEQKPHLVFHNFKTPLAERTMKILKYLFPVPRKDSKRVMTFANHDDYICFRHHTYQYVNKELQLKEVGPRFQLKLYQIKLGTLDELQSANVEWVLRPYMNTAAKRRFLSDEDGWAQDNEESAQFQ